MKNVCVTCNSKPLWIAVNISGWGTVKKNYVGSKNFGLSCGDAEDKCD